MELIERKSLFSMFGRLRLCVGANFLLWPMELLNLVGEFFLVFFVFPICSHQVPIVFLKTLPIATHILSHVCLAIVLLSVGKGKHDQAYFYFGIINRSINKYPQNCYLQMGFLAHYLFILFFLSEMRKFCQKKKKKKKPSDL